jgi:hypothetical protein
VRAEDPEGPPIDLFDLEEWTRHGWGLASSTQEPVLQQLLPEATTEEARRRIALDHLRKVLGRARRFHAALDAPATAPPGLTLYLFAGDAVATPAVVEADSGGTIRVRSTAPGDGRSCAPAR